MKREGYNPATGEGAVGFEFVTPSITTANMNEQEAVEIPGYGIYYPLEERWPERYPITLAVEEMFLDYNPHMRPAFSIKVRPRLWDTTPGVSSFLWSMAMLMRLMF